MRIAIVTDWFPPRRGGIENQLFQLATRLATRGHDVEVLTSTPAAKSGTGFAVRQLRVATLPGLDIAISPALPWALRDELRQGYDVVHSHVSVVSPVAYSAAAIARSLDLPTVVTFHSVLRHKRHLLRACDALWGLSRSACVWSAVSGLVANQVESAFTDSCVTVLPNGIDLALWRSPHQAAPTSEEIKLVSTMRLHRKKRPQQLLDAFYEAAARTRSKISIVITGDGPERGGLEREIRLRPGRKVELRGWLEENELRKLYSNSDAFVLASEREAFGIAALEARAAGLPVLTLDASGSREFLRNDLDALLVATDSELADAIVRFAEIPALRERLSRSQPDLRRYDWSTVVAQHEAAYARAMSRATVAAEAAASSA